MGLWPTRKHEKVVEIVIMAGNARPTNQLFGAQQPGRLFHRKRKTENFSKRRFCR